MAYKLAIEDLVGVKVEGKSRDKNGVEKTFKFTLVCERYTQDQMKIAVSDKDESASDFVEKVARDWQGQPLVLDDDDKPAAFSVEALAVLLTITGMAVLCFHSYVQQAGATAKN
jgi:hypothetical protein